MSPPGVAPASREVSDEAMESPSDGAPGMTLKLLRAVNALGAAASQRALDACADARPCLEVKRDYECNNWKYNGVYLRVAGEEQAKSLNARDPRHSADRPTPSATWRNGRWDDRA